MSEPTSKKFRKLSRLEWIKAEEMYRQGETQAKIAETFGIRIESVSRHMTKAAIKGGDKVEVVKKEIEAAVMRRKKEFAEKRENRKVVAKEQAFGITTALLGLFAQDVKRVKEKGAAAHSAEIGVAGKALKEGLAGVSAAYDLLARVLDITPGEDKTDDLPQLQVVTMSAEEEEALRNAKALSDEEEEELEEESSAPADEEAAE